MTLKKLFLAAMASVLVSTGMQAQVENFETPAMSVAT